MRTDINKIWYTESGMTDDYELIDSGDGRKFERFGAYTLVRPCSQAMWRPRDAAAWRMATASFASNTPSPLKSSASVRS